MRNIKKLGKSDNPLNKRRKTLMAYNLMFKEDKKKMKKSGIGLFYFQSKQEVEKIRKISLSLISPKLKFRVTQKKINTQVDEDGLNVKR